MTQLVLTVVGDDRAGLVAALADVVSTHGGNWEHSQLAELAGTFAGIVVVSVPDEHSDDLISALDSLAGLLKVSIHLGSDSERAEPPQQLTIDVLGNDHPGIVRDISAVLHRHEVSIENLTSEARDAPMSGGRLFEAKIVAAVPAGADPAAIQSDLERLAAELLVDITLAG